MSRAFDTVRARGLGKDLCMRNGGWLGFVSLRIYVCVCFFVFHFEIALYVFGLRVKCVCGPFGVRSVHMNLDSMFVLFVDSCPLMPKLVLITSGNPTVEHEIHLPQHFFHLSDSGMICVCPRFVPVPIYLSVTQGIYDCLQFLQIVCPLI